MVGTYTVLRSALWTNRVRRQRFTVAGLLCTRWSADVLHSQVFVSELWSQRPCWERPRRHGNVIPDGVASLG
jgi:hypothetical protein